MNKIEFTTDDNDKAEFYVISQTRVHNTNYLLVTETDATDEAEEAEAYILKDISEEESEEASYVFVEDDVELEAVAKVFEQELEEDDIEIEA